MDKEACRCSLVGTSYSPCCPLWRARCMRRVEETLTAREWIAARTWTDPRWGERIAGLTFLAYGAVYFDCCLNVDVDHLALICTPRTMPPIERAPRDSAREMLNRNQLSSRGLPSASSASCLECCQHVYQTVSHRPLLTVVALRDPILYSSALCQIRYLRPVFVWIGTGAERTA